MGQRAFQGKEILLGEKKRQNLESTKTTEAAIFINTRLLHYFMNTRLIHPEDVIINPNRETHTLNFHISSVWN